MDTIKLLNERAASYGALRQSSLTAVAMDCAAVELAALEAELSERVHELAAAHATIHQLRDTAAKAAGEYAEEVARLRQRIGNLEGLLGQCLPYVTKCADMDLADAVACMKIVEHELRAAPERLRK